MNHHDIDPSLLPGEPLNDSLDDGSIAPTYCMTPASLGITC